jgi:hypothetical protein
VSKLRKVTARYAQVAWTVIQSDQLSFAAKGIYADLMSRPDDWRISVEALAGHGPDGRAAVATAVDELVGVKVYHRIKARRGGVWHTFVLLTAEPIEPAEAIKLLDLPPAFTDVQPDTRRKTPRSRRNVPGNEDGGSRVAGHPEPEDPDDATVSTSEEMGQNSELLRSSAQEIIKAWVDWLEDRPPSRVVGQVAKLVGEMLEEQIPPDRIKAGLAEMSRRAVHPSVLPSLVAEQQVRARRANRTDLAPTKSHDGGRVMSNGRYVDTTPTPTPPPARQVIAELYPQQTAEDIAADAAWKAELADLVKDLQ